MANEKERDHYFDNARFFLIVLVVFGHLTRSYVNDSHIFKALYMFIYSFHMPAFVLISGFFAKGVGKPGYIKKITIKLLLPYLIFQLFYGLYYYYIDRDDTLNISPFRSTMGNVVLSKFILMAYYFAFCEKLQSIYHIHSSNIIRFSCRLF
ncbi:acyltransferase family protein [Mammaliicoccus sciuri]